MNVKRCFIFFWATLIIFASCEKVIDVDLNTSEPAMVVEGFIYNDSVSQVHLTRTTSYFSSEEPEIIEDATVWISDGNTSEELEYRGNGYYAGTSVTGIENRNYRLEIEHNGTTYNGDSYMPLKSEIISLRYIKDESVSIFNPFGKIVYTIVCVFRDDPATDNYYMIRFMKDNKMVKDSYYLLTENNANNGSISNDNNIITFEESVFFEGGEVDVQLLSIDKRVYMYFTQLNDVLFWKRRVIPPTPYNPESNIDNGALGYFAAWAYDSQRIVLE